jgi:hypothetical protein
VAAALIESLYHIELAGRDHAANEAAIARVAHAFRGDVRAFPSASIGKFLTLSDDDAGRYVSYRIQGDQIGRFEWQGLTLVSQDWFPLPPRSAPRFEKAEEGGRVAVSLVIRRRARRQVGESIVRPERLEATLGADRRFEEARR